MEWTNEKKIKYIKYSIILLIVFFIGFYLYIPLSKVLMPFLLSLILSYLISPIVVYFENIKFPKIWSIVCAYIIILLIIIVLVWIVFPIVNYNVKEVINKLPEIVEEYKELTFKIVSKYKFVELPYPLKQGLINNYNNILNIINNFIEDILNILMSIISNILYILLIPIITFYFLKDGEYLKKKLILMLPHALRDEALVTWYQIDLILQRFIRGELIVASIVGTFSFIGLYILGVKFSLILGLIAGVTNFIPYIGPIIGIIPAVLIAFVDSPTLALKAGLIFIIIQQIESGIISPKIVGESVGLHPITIIFSILLAERIFGVIGMFFALPSTLIIIIIFNRFINKIFNKRYS